MKKKMGPINLLCDSADVGQLEEGKEYELLNEKFEIKAHMEIDEELIKKAEQEEKI